ncbi:MAG: RNA polymerase sigma factor FliA [Acidobacteria bacterium]|nr:RNA polymerase sigma factor FliA [Acidobacteriota bacterium]
MSSVERRPSALAQGGLSDVEGRNQLVLEHVGLVKTLAQRLAQRLPSQVQLSDLVGVGVLGLIDAAGRYKPTLGVPFDAFARRRIQGAMLDSLRELDWAPRSLRRLRRDVDAAIGALRKKLDREPEEAEIAAALSLSQAEYERVLEQLRTLDIGSVRSLDAPSEDGTPRLELCVDPEENVGRRLERQELRQHLARAVGELPARERQILALYYEEELTLAEIGAVIGVCESRVSQLRSLAIARLRTRLHASLEGAKPSEGSARDIPAQPSAGSAVSCGALRAPRKAA